MRSYVCRVLPPDDRKGVSWMKLPKLILKVRFLGWRLVLILR